MSKNDYYSIAIDEIDIVEVLMHAEKYNYSAMHTQQVIEKLLKSVAILVCTDNLDKTLKSHNLRFLYKEIQKFYMGIELDEHLLKYISDFYIDSRYPGEDYIYITENECIESYMFLKEVVNKINNFRALHGFEIIERKWD